MRFIFYTLISFCLLPQVSAQKFDWVETFGSDWSTEYERINGITTDNNGNVYTIGQFYNSLKIDSIILINNSSGIEGFITKHDSLGNLIWVNKLESSYVSIYHSISIDTSNNLYLIGYFRGQVDFDFNDSTSFLIGTVGNNLDTETFVHKIDDDGQFIWAKAFHFAPRTQRGYLNFGHQIAIDHNTDILVSGWFMNKVDFDPGPDTNYLTQQNTRGSAAGDAYLVKLDQLGSLIWAKQYSTAIAEYTSNGIAIDSFNNIHLVGYYRDTTILDSNHTLFPIDSFSTTDTYYSKIDPDGNILLTKSLGSKKEEIYLSNISINPNNETYLTGKTKGAVRFEDTLVMFDSKPDSGNYILKLDSAGNLKNALLINDGVDCDIANITYDTYSDRIIIVGNYSGTVDFNFGNQRQVLVGKKDDIFIAYIDANLSNGYVKGFGGNGYEKVNGVKAGTDSTHFTIGHFSDVVDFDPGSSIFKDSSRGGYDLFIQKFSPCTNVYFSKKDTICQGESLLVGTSIYTKEGAYINVFTSASGCDSIVTTNLKVNRSYSYTLNLNICEGDSIFHNGAHYDTTGSYSFKYLTTEGCDSIVTIAIKANPIFTTRSKITICSGDSIQIGTNSYFNTGNYIDTLQTHFGCDSIIQTNLIVHPTVQTNQTIRLCFGEQLVVGSSTYIENGNYSDTLTTKDGCDSLIFTNLTIDNQLETFQEITLCGNDSIQVGSSVYIESGVFQDTLVASSGCDSLVRTTIQKVNLRVDTTLFNSLQSDDLISSYQWLDCLNNYEPIPGATSRSFDFKTNGSFALELTYQNCTVITPCYSAYIKPFTSEIFKIFPNPNKGDFKVEVSDFGELQLFDSRGKLCAIKQCIPGLNQINNQNLSSGVYHAKFKTNDKVLVSKIVIAE